MVRSMTAFARVAAGGGSQKWIVELRSLNSRYLELSVRAPGSLNALEAPIRDLVGSYIRRGKVTLGISQDGEPKKDGRLDIDEAAVRFYTQKVKRLKKKFGLKGELEIGDLLRLPGIFSSEASEEDPQEYWPSLKKVLQEALRKAVRAKEIEGAKLSKDIRTRIKMIRQAAGKIEKLSAGRTGKIFEKLSERVNAILRDTGKDPDRVHREVAFLAERSDITEEIVRLRSHLDLFAGRMNGVSSAPTEEGAEMGRELDFLCQEMNREVNTMGSKAQLFEITTEVVAMKGELEKIREQVQNIE